MFNYKNEELYQTQNYYINYLFDLYGSDKGTLDDGLHTFEAAIILFENSIKYLKFNGIYIIEDVNNSD